jgi:hypothetical protein
MDSHRRSPSDSPPIAARRKSATPLLLTLSVACVIGVMCCVDCRPAAAEDWMYRRSYFSHEPLPGVTVNHPVPDSRSAYREAYYRGSLGFSFRSAYRVNNYVIQNGNRFDRTLYREGYVEFDP